MIKKTLGPLLQGHAIKLDKISMTWTLEQIKAIRPQPLFEKLIEIGAVYVDKGASVSLMLLPTVDGAPVPQRVKAGKRDREEVAPLPRHAPAVVAEDLEEALS